MTPDVPAVAALLLTFALHSTVLIAVATLPARWCRRRDAHRTEERIWRIALLAALVTTPVQVFGRAAAGPALAHLGPIASAPAQGPPATPLPPAAPVAVPDAAGPVAAPADPLDWPTLLVALAGLASAGRLGSWALRRRHLGRRLAGRRPADGELRAILAGLLEGSPLRRRPRLTVDPSLRSPIALGTFRPEIVLPARARRSSGPLVRAMLAHELAHLERADPRWRLVLDALEILAPWQLLLRPVRRRLELLAEYQCDERAARRAGRTPAARSVVQVAGWIAEPPPAAPLAVSGMAGPGPLSGRVDRLLEGRIADRGAPWSPRLFAFCALLATPLLPGAAWEPTEPAPATRATEAAAAPVATVLREALAGLDTELALLRQRVDDLRNRARQDPDLHAWLPAVEERLRRIAAQRDALHALVATHLESPFPDDRRHGGDR